MKVIKKELINDDEVTRLRSLQLDVGRWVVTASIGHWLGSNGKTRIWTSVQSSLSRWTSFVLSNWKQVWGDPSWLILFIEWICVRLFFVIEYVSGGDLMFHMQKQRRLPEDHARQHPLLIFPVCFLIFLLADFTLLKSPALWIIFTKEVQELRGNFLCPDVIFLKQALYIVIWNWTTCFLTRRVTSSWPTMACARSAFRHLFYCLPTFLIHVGRPSARRHN